MLTALELVVGFLDGLLLVLCFLQAGEQGLYFMLLGLSWDLRVLS